MKIKKIAYRNKYKLLKLKLVTSKIVQKFHIFDNNISISDIETRLKKALKLIYLYHIQNKKILFIGNPLSINKEVTKVLRKTKHIFIPKSAWISGLITNQKSSFNFFFKKENKTNNSLYQKLLQLKKKSDLVIIMNEKTEAPAIEESYNARLPVISLNSSLNPFNFKSSYKIPGNFICSKNKLKNSFFYLLLVSTIKKANRHKKRFPLLVHKTGNLKYFRKRKYVLLKKKKKKKYKSKFRRKIKSFRFRYKHNNLKYLKIKRTRSSYSFRSSITRIRKNIFKRKKNDFSKKK